MAEKCNIEFSWLEFSERVTRSKETVHGEAW